MRRVHQENIQREMHLLEASYESTDGKLPRSGPNPARLTPLSSNEVVLLKQQGWNRGKRYLAPCYTYKYGKGIFLCFFET